MAKKRRTKSTNVINKKANRKKYKENTPIRCTLRKMGRRYVKNKELHGELSTEASLHSKENMLSIPDEHINPYDKIILSKYGSDILKYYNEKETSQLIIFNDLIDDSTYESNDIRRLLHSLSQVIDHYNLAPETYFLTSYIINAYLTKQIQNSQATSSSIKDLQLLGLTAFYIASKMTDILPLRVNELSSVIGHKLFAPDDIVEKECDILNMIDYDLDILSTYDIIQIIFCDCTTYSQAQIEGFEMKEEMKMLKKIAVQMAKMIEGNRTMIKIRLTLKAIACIVVAFDILRSGGLSSGLLTDDMITFMKSWVTMLVKRNSYTNEIIHPVYNMIKEDYMKEIIEKNGRDKGYFFKKDN